jgi:hypothetical protein
MVEVILKYEHRFGRDFLSVHQMLEVRNWHEMPDRLAAFKLYTDQEITNHLSFLLEVACRIGR